jgi:HAD superfamily hydrolase (TIGR01509 family)
VLIDSETIACRAESACLGEFGITISSCEMLDRYVGISLQAMLKDFQTRFERGLPAELPDMLRLRVAEAFEADLEPIPGVERLLQTLSIPFCVASGSEMKRIRHTLELTRLLKYFEPHLFSASQVAHGKPAPDLFLFAAKGMGVAPERCIVIEDSVPGVRAGIAAGMTVIGFVGGSHCRSGHADKLRDAGASAVTAQMDELPGLIVRDG